jgi:hypothetical protein
MDYPLVHIRFHKSCGNALSTKGFVLNANQNWRCVLWSTSRICFSFFARSSS